MAVLFEGFSIREYTRKTRSVDVVKSWPFGGEIGRDSMESFLPPIAVPKSRWWSHEIVVMRAAEKSDDKRRRGNKARPRAPKKRSIVDIFAATPPIRKKNEVIDGGNKVDGRSIKFKNKAKPIKLGTTKVLTRKKGKKNERKSKEFSRHNWMPKKVNGHSMPTEVGLGTTKYSSGTAENMLSMTASSKKRGRFHCLCRKKKDELVRLSKSVTKDEELVLPVRSILRNKSKVTPGHSTSGCNSRNPDLVNHLSQHEKRVRFSDQRCAISVNKKKVSPLEQNLHDISSEAQPLFSGKDQSSERSRESPADNVDHPCGEVPTNAASCGQSVIAKEQLPDACDTVSVQNFLGQRSSFCDREKNLTSKHAPLSDNGICHDDCNMNYHNGGAVSPRALNPSWMLSNNYASHVPCFSENSLKENAHLFPRITSSGFTLAEIENGRTPLLSQSASEHSYLKQLQLQTSGYQSTYEMMSSLRPLQEWTQNAAALGKRHVDEEVFGLPLNSHGELVTGKATGCASFDQLGCASVCKGAAESVHAEGKLFLGAVGEFPTRRKHVTERTLAKDRLDAVPGHIFGNERPHMCLPARLGVDETFPENSNAIQQNYDSGRIHCVHSLNSDVNSKSHAFDFCRQNHQIQNQYANDTVESRNIDHVFSNNPPLTMRLMGKDVAVGRNFTEMQLSWARKVWAHERIISENCNVTSIPSPINDLLLKRDLKQDWLLRSASGTSEESLTKSSDGKWPHSRQFNATLGDCSPGYLISHCNCPAQGNKNLNPNLNPSPAFVKVSPPSTCSRDFGRDVSFHGSGSTWTDTSLRNLKLPQPSTPWSISPLTDNSTTNPNIIPVIPHGRKSSFEFPFLHLDSGKHARSPWSRNHILSSAPWLDTTQQTNTSVSHLFHDKASNQKPCAIVPNHLGALATPHASVIYPPRPCINMRNSFGATSTKQSQHLPPVYGLETKCSTIMRKRKRINVKDGMKPTAFVSKDAKSFKINNKSQEAGLEGQPTKPSKITKLRRDVGLEAVKDLPPENLSINKHVNAVDLDVSSDDAGKGDGTQTLPPVDDLRASSINEFWGNGMQMGPIKLSAGDKHVLKPNQKMDQDSSRSMLSSVPLVSARDCNSLSGPQTKSSKVYRF